MDNRELMTLPVDFDFSSKTLKSSELSAQDQKLLKDGLEPNATHPSAKNVRELESLPHDIDWKGNSNKDNVL